MEDNKLVKKPRNHHPERINLTPDAHCKVTKWITQVTPRLKGSNINRSQLVSWLLSRREDELSEVEIAGIVDAFFDPIKAVLNATKHLKAKQKAGESLDIKAFLAEALSTGNRKPKNKQTKRPPKETPQILFKT